jgi:hypothetical protein
MTDNVLPVTHHSGIFLMLCFQKVCNVFFNSLNIILTNKCCGSALVSMRIQFRMTGFDGKIVKFDSKKILIFCQKLQFTVFILRPPCRTSKLQEKPPALKQRTASASKQQFFTFLYFLPTWIRVKPTKILKINADPDQQHCYK